MKVSELKEGYLYKDYEKRGHCKNGTFKVKIKNGLVSIADTYWNDNYFIATDENVKDFEEVLKLDEYNICRWNTVKDYDEKDYIQVHYGQCSGRSGFEYTDYFLRKGATKSKDILVGQLQDRIKSLKSSLANNEVTLKKLENDEITTNQVFVW